MQPDTHYARSGDLHIAYQVFGTGSVDLVLVPGFISNVERPGTIPAQRAGCTGSLDLHG